MFKKLGFMLVLFAAGCTGPDYEYEICPRVQIVRDNAYVTQVVNSYEQFQITLKGFDGYCFYDSRIEQNKALINPVFEIKRLRPSSETDVHFAYYTETVKGPPAYIGRKTHHVVAHIGSQAREIEFKAPQVMVYVPEEMKYSFDINLGLVISPEERKYNQRTFDINYRYINQ